MLEKFGLQAWEDIIVDAGFKKEEAWVLSDYYSDGDTVNIVVAAAAKLGVDAGAVLEIYGGYFPKFLIDNQLDKMLHLMGNNLKDFLYNLDYLQCGLQTLNPPNTRLPAPPHPPHTNQLKPRAPASWGQGQNVDILRFRDVAVGVDVCLISYCHFDVHRGCPQS